MVDTFLILYWSIVHFDTRKVVDRIQQDNFLIFCWYIFHWHTYMAVVRKLKDNYLTFGGTSVHCDKHKEVEHILLGNFPNVHLYIFRLHSGMEADDIQQDSFPILRWYIFRNDIHIFLEVVVWKKKIKNEKPFFCFITRCNLVKINWLSPASRTVTRLFVDQCICSFITSTFRTNLTIFWW